MKPITWLNASKLNPNVTLDKLEEIATVRKGSNSISFSSFRYIEYIGIIQSQLKFPKTDEEIGQEWVVTKAVNRCLLSNSLNKNDLIEVANEVLADALAKQQDTYHLLTSISVAKAFPVRRIKVAGCVVSFYETSYPKKYKGREEAVHSNYASTHNIEHKNYIKCVVTTKAKYSKSAARKALYALDYIRACFCLMGNPVIEFNSGESFDKPINIIRLGKFHTLHNKLGKALEDELWFEPNFFEHAKVPLSHPDRHRNNLDHFQKKLAASKYSGTIRDSLVRYVRSCDERDSNTCFIKLWGTLVSVR